MSQRFKADKATVDHVVHCDLSIQHWACESVQLDIKKQGLIETVKALGASKQQAVRDAVKQAGYQPDKVLSARLDIQSGEIEVVLADDPEAPSPPG